MVVRLGVVGYGLGGRCFHTPFIEAAEGIELAGVVTRSPVRRAEVEQDWPGVRVFDSLQALLASGVGAVTITKSITIKCEGVLATLGSSGIIINDAGVRRQELRSSR